MMNNRQKLATLCISSFSLFIILAIFVSLGLTNDFDFRTNYFYTSIESPFLLFLSLGAHYIFSTESMIIASVLVCGYLLYRNYRKESYMIAIGMILDVILVWSLKHLIARERPIFNLFADTGFAFPSGHATASLVFLGLLSIVLITRYSDIKIRRIIEVTAGAMIGVVGFSRIYLGVHYFTDVFAGFLLGTGILALTVYIFKKWDLFFSTLRK